MIHAEFSSQHTQAVACDVEVANLTNSGFRELGLVVSFTTGAGRFRPSTFANHIAHVLALRTKKEMVWAHTSRLIAMMADALSGWNWAIRQRPRDPMGQYNVGAVPSLTVTMLRGSRPQPTRVGFSDVSPESLNVFALHAAIVAQHC